MLVLGTLSALLGLGLLAGATATGWADFLQRDGAYLTTPSERYETASYALTSPGLADGQRWPLAASGVSTSGTANMKAHSSRPWQSPDPAILFNLMGLGASPLWGQHPLCEIASSLWGPKALTER